MNAQQDAHYWSHQYGAKGLLLNGAVIASPAGETSIFYNPGSMILDRNLGFTFSYLSPTYSNLKLNNLLGDQNTINDRGISYAPGFAGVRFNPFETRKLVFGFATFKRYKTDIRFQDRVETASLPSQDLLRADVDFERRVSEDWFAFGLSYALTDNLGIGFSQFSVWHSQDFIFDFVKEVTDQNNPLDIIASWHSDIEYNIGFESGFISKAGINYSSDNLGLGLTFTSPLYSIIKSTAKYKEEDVRFKTNQLARSNSNRNRVSEVQYKTPTSIGFGLDFTVKETKFSLAGEYFFKVKKYTVFEDNDTLFNGLSTLPYVKNINVTSRNKGVLNIALGLQYNVSKKFTWFAGFRTDFNQDNVISINKKVEYLGSVGDVYHLSTGGNFKVKKNQFAAGIDLAYGLNTGGLQLIDFNREVSPSNLFEFTNKNNVTSRLYSVMLFFTYDFIFSSWGDKKEE